MADKLSGEKGAIALLGMTIPSGATFVVPILVFGLISGAHFKSAVPLAFAIRKKIDTVTSALYAAVQVFGGICGVMIAHLMFDNAIIDPSTTDRTGLGQYAGEFVATFGLVVTILRYLKTRSDAILNAVGIFITVGYSFTSPTSFANPAVTIARGLTSTISSIDPAHITGFIAVQLVAAVVATVSFKWLLDEHQVDVSGAPAQDSVG